MGKYYTIFSKYWLKKYFSLTETFADIVKEIKLLKFAFWHEIYIVKIK